jgi:hypothetical protein
MIEPTSKKVFYCKVHKCPMESDAPVDDKLTHQIAMKETFGDDFNIVNCEKVRTDSGKTLLCEMLVECSDSPVREKCPKYLDIVMEIESDV